MQRDGGEANHILMKHKKQHTIPATYLRAWCDPSVPPKHDPYVWVFPKNGGHPRKKAPENIFHEADFYTIHTSDGERDLFLEQQLGQVESLYSEVARKLRNSDSLSLPDKEVLCLFVAVMFSRTKSRRGYWLEQWQRVLDMGNRFAEFVKHASQEQKEELKNPPFLPDKNMKSFSLDDVKEMVANPVQSFLPTEITTMTPYLVRMKFTILQTPSPSFLTSDSPCVQFDPTTYLNPKPDGAGGLLSPTIEIGMPLSPRQYVIFANQMDTDGLIAPVQPNHKVVTSINFRTTAYADQYVIFNQEKVDPNWFVEPKTGHDNN